MSHRSAEQCILLNYVTIGFDVMNKFDRIQNSAACNTNENTYVCVCVCVCVCELAAYMYTYYAICSLYTQWSRKVYVFYR